MTFVWQPVAELGRERWESEGLEVCGYCFCGFDAARPPHRVVMVRDERSGTYRYSEDRPWHEECVALKNAEPPNYPFAGAGGGGPGPAVLP
jgi:hypothetical protein